MSNAIRVALETALNGMSPSLATAWENAATVPPATTTAYQKAELLMAEPDNPSYGDGLVRQQGIFQVTLCYPLGAGTASAETRAAAIATLFKRGASFTSSGVTVVIDRTPTVGQGSSDGERWVIPVKVRFYANIFS